MSLIVLEGIDKSGKATQTKIIMTKLKENGKNVEVITFPDYTTRIGELIRKYLEDKVDFCPEVRQCLYVANRWERVQDLKIWLKQGKVVIADRYVPSGLVYGTANGLDLEWMINLEKGLPTPDMVIVIDVSVDVAFEREAVRDKYEQNIKFLTKVRQSYLDLALTFNWVVIDGEKSTDEVTNQIWKHVLKILAI